MNFLSFLIKTSLKSQGEKRTKKGRDIENVETCRRDISLQKRKGQLRGIAYKEKKTVQRRIQYFAAAKRKKRVADVSLFNVDTALDLVGAGVKKNVSKRTSSHETRGCVGGTVIENQISPCLSPAMAVIKGRKGIR
jgi:hypothetical protein